MSQSKALMSEMKQETPSRGVFPLRMGTSSFVPFLLACIVLAVWVECARSEPPVVPHVLSPVHRFGEVKTGAVVEHAFAIVNPTDVAVRITRVRTSCGCTAAKVAPEVIPPQGKAALRVVFKTVGRRGPQRKHVFISTDYPQAAFLRCSVEGKILPPELEPPIVGPKTKPPVSLPAVADSAHDFGTQPSGAVVTHDFQIRNKGTAWLEIQKVRTNCGCLVGEVTPKRIAPGKSGVLHVVFKTGERGGRQRLAVRVMTNSLTKRVLVCWVEGTLVRSVAVPQVPARAPAAPAAPDPPPAVD